MTIATAVLHQGDRRLGYRYMVLDAAREVIWERTVLFGLDKRHRANGAAMREAAAEQERVALQLAEGSAVPPNDAEARAMAAQIADALTAYWNGLFRFVSTAPEQLVISETCESKRH